MKAAYRGVTAFIGLPGSGKSYSMVEQIARDLRAGRTVYVNQGFEVKDCLVYRSFEEMLVVPPGSSIYIDEAPIFFNSRKWQEFPDALMYRFNQLRKDDLRLYWSAQHESRADVVLRQLTAQFWHCRGLTSRFFIRALWSPEDFRKAAERPFRRQLVRVRRKHMDSYDTLAKVAIPLSLLDRIRTMREDPWIEVSPDESLADLLERTKTTVAVFPPPVKGGDRLRSAGRPGATSQRSALGPSGLRSSSAAIKSEPLTGVGRSDVGRRFDRPKGVR